MRPGRPAAPRPAPPRRAHLGLGRKFALLIGLLLLGFTTLVVGTNIAAEERDLRDRLRERAVGLGELVADLAAVYVHDLKVSDLEIIFQDVARQPEVVYAFTLDTEGVTLVEENPEEDNLLQVVDDPLARWSMATAATAVEAGPDAVHVAAPVRLGREVIGVVRLGLSLARLRAEAGKIWRRNLLLGAVFLAVGLAATHLLIARVTRPLAALTELARAASTGRFDGKIEVASNDELQDLAEAFNRMLASLRASVGRINRLAYVDGVTELANRASFVGRLEAAVRASVESGRGCAVLFLDLDRFKRVNDTLGHATGDRLLHAFAARLQTCVREGDLVVAPGPGAGPGPADGDQPPAAAGPEASGSLVARLGGDEFTVLLADAGSAAAAATVAGRILDAVRRPFVLDGQEVAVGTSIGIALVPADGTDPETVLKHADTAMYHAKEQGRNNFQFFNPQLDARLRERVAVENGLRRALAEGELVAHWQPQLDCATGRLVGAEALVRWRHPEQGLLAPAAFVPVAEETGLIREIDLWMLREACAQARRWLDEDGRGLRVAVNLSAQHFRGGNLPALVAGVLADAGLPPGLLELEITESLAMHEGSEVREQVSALRGLGVRIAIDDFGTGYSSLAYLKRYAVDCIKIDRSFVKDATADPDAAAIVGAILAVAAALGCETVAEGIETEAQMALVRTAGCDGGQGFLISPPVPIEELERWRDGDAARRHARRPAGAPGTARA